MISLRVLICTTLVSCLCFGIARGAYLDCIDCDDGDETTTDSVLVTYPFLNVSLGIMPNAIVTIFDYRESNTEINSKKKNLDLSKHFSTSLTACLPTYVALASGSVMQQSFFNTLYTENVNSTRVQVYADFYYHTYAKNKWVNELTIEYPVDYVGFGKEHGKHNSHFVSHIQYGRLYDSNTVRDNLATQMCFDDCGVVYANGHLVYKRCGSRGCFYMDLDTIVKQYSPTITLGTPYLVDIFTTTRDVTSRVKISEYANITRMKCEHVRGDHDICENVETDCPEPYPCNEMRCIEGDCVESYDNDLECTLTGLTVCQQTACVGGACAVLSITDGTPCTAANTSYCDKTACLDGECVAAPDATKQGNQCPYQGVIPQCQTPVCISQGGCALTAKTDGTPCTIANLPYCADSVCQSGECVPILDQSKLGKPCTYQGITPQCQSATCSESGECILEHLANHTTCTLPNNGPCKNSGCISGECVPLNAQNGMECTLPMETECMPSTCQEGECVPTPVEDLTPCTASSSAACKMGGCVSGACVLVADPEMEGVTACDGLLPTTCNGSMCVSGDCVTVPMAENGTPCEPSGVCWLGLYGKCTNGACVPDDIDPCFDGLSCTRDSCQSDGCHNTRIEGCVECAVDDVECIANVSIPQCSKLSCDNTSCALVADLGKECDDDNACTPSGASWCDLAYDPVLGATVVMCVAHSIESSESQTNPCIDLVCDYDTGITSATYLDGVACGEGDAGRCLNGECYKPCETDLDCAELSTEPCTAFVCHDPGLCLFKVKLTHGEPCGEDEICDEDGVCVEQPPPPISSSSEGEEVVSSSVPITPTSSSPSSQGTGQVDCAVEPDGTACIPNTVIVSTCLNFTCDNGVCTNQGPLMAGTECMDCTGTYSGTCNGESVYCVLHEGIYWTNVTEKYGDCFFTQQPYVLGHTPVVPISCTSVPTDLAIPYSAAVDAGYTKGTCFDKSGTCIEYCGDLCPIGPSSCDKSVDPKAFLYEPIILAENAFAANSMYAYLYSGTAGGVPVCAKVCEPNPLVDHVTGIGDAEKNVVIACSSGKLEYANAECTVDSDCAASNRSKCMEPYCLEGKCTLRDTCPEQAGMIGVCSYNPEAGCLYSDATLTGEDMITNTRCAVQKDCSHYDVLLKERNYALNALVLDGDYDSTINIVFACINGTCTQASDCMLNILTGNEYCESPYQCIDIDECSTDSCVDHKCVHTPMELPQDSSACYIWKCDAVYGVYKEYTPNNPECV